MAFSPDGQMLASASFDRSGGDEEGSAVAKQRNEERWAFFSQVTADVDERLQQLGGTDSVAGD